MDAEGSGRPSPLVLPADDELLRAIRRESAAAQMHWFGVATRAVWQWRRAFLDGAGKFRTPHQRASKSGGKGMKARGWSDEERDAIAERAKQLGSRPYPPHVGGRAWTAKELRLLGTAPDAEVAVKLGRTETAVRLKRRKVRQ